MQQVRWELLWLVGSEVLIFITINEGALVKMYDFRYAIKDICTLGHILNVHHINAKNIKKLHKQHCFLLSAK